MQDACFYIVTIDICWKFGILGGYVGPGAYFTPTWQGKGAILNLHRSTFASGYEHYKCHKTMLQCRIWGRGTGNACEWEALTQQGTQGEKTENLSLRTCCEFQPGYCYYSCGVKYRLI